MIDHTSENNLKLTDIFFYEYKYSPENNRNMEIYRKITM